jgi:hypothetical protein
MATTTFNGTVRSDGDIKTTTKNTSTGAFVDYVALKSTGAVEIQKVATDYDNIVAAGTSTGANNASLGTAATQFMITPNSHGSGIADTAINTFVNKVGGLIYTHILVDLHGGLASGGGADDIIGTDGGTANAYIAELTTAVNGIPFEIEMACLEVPTGGDPDINLVCSATGTDAENAAVTSGTVLLNNGDLSLGMYVSADGGATLAALTKKYLYLTTGAATEAAYTAGKLVIKITGAAFDYNNG